MLILLSPAKTLDFESTPSTRKSSQPILLEDSAELIDVLRSFSQQELANLMGMSDALAQQNAQRFADWTTPFTLHNARQAILAFRGQVFDGLDVDSYSAQDFTTAQSCLRILSGLHGVLRPLDLIQPYRLEMGTRLKTARGKHLYEFWGSKITQWIQADLVKDDAGVLINLASQEYFKSIQKKDLSARVITPGFKEERDGGYKQITFFAKVARGQMATYIIRNKLTNPEMIKEFDVDGYQFNDSLSSADNWIFTR